MQAIIMSNFPHRRTSDIAQDSFEAVNRYIQPLLVALFIGLMGWVGVSLTSANENMSRLEERVAFLQRDVALLGKQLSEQVPMTNSMRDRLTVLESTKSQQDSAINDLKSRLTVIEKK